MTFKDTTSEAINLVMEKSLAAFRHYRKLPLSKRAAFMYEIASRLESAGDHLIEIAMEETHLPEARLRSERARTVFQLQSYGRACEEGSWLEARIDTAIPDRNPPKPDIRKMLVPLGPVIVFGSSNFPFAYSTAGGDTACAFAAGCSVVVKAHPAHPQTSAMVAEVIQQAVKASGMPEGIFAHVFGAGFETGRLLVTHPFTKAVGFTGSFAGGKQLFDWANQRTEPIPVFAEMGSINPVFLLPDMLKKDAVAMASIYAGSITLGVGQFCTNPGLVIGIDGPELQTFTRELGLAIERTSPGPMLHPGIRKAYQEKKTLAISQQDVEVVAEIPDPGTDPLLGTPMLAMATGAAFLNNPVLHKEVFGPYSLIIRCKNQDEIMQVAQKIEGQLTTTLMATETDMDDYPELVETVKDICGRLIINGVPTGVEVCLGMQHGGPFPATTDSRYTSVGADGIRRFARPLAFQNWPNLHLPEALKNENPLGIWRTVNNELTRKAID